MSSDGERGGARGTRVLIADDHPLFRMGLGYALRGRGFQVVAEAENGRHAVELARTHPPDVAVLDVKMPDMDGVEACRALRALPQPPLVVMLTSFEEPAIVVAAREAGAVAYLAKDTAPARLAELLERIVAEPDRNWMPRVDLPALTRRELEVLRLLARGGTNKSIASDLGIGAETVKDYLGSVYRKLGVGDRLAAVAEAQRYGLV